MRYFWLGLFLIGTDALLGARLSTDHPGAGPPELAVRADPDPFAVSHQPFHERLLDDHLRHLLGQS